MKEIKISKSELKRLYVKEKLTTYQIADRLKCSPTGIQRKLKVYGIEIRIKKLIISKKELENLYLKQKLSTYKIAKIYNCDPKTIYRKLKIYGIKTRPLKTINIPKHELEELYINKKLSLYEIAKKHNCNTVTVFDKMNKYKIKRRSLSESSIIHPKTDFSGNLEEKAYLIGFRLGDLNVVEKDSIIIVKTNTTKLEQVELMKNIFGDYSYVYSKKNKDVFYTGCILNKSFSFLSKKEDRIESWILNNEKYFFAFLGGYTDAEGNIGVYNGKARFRVGSYDKFLLYQTFRKLESLGINIKYFLEDHERYKQEFWRIGIYSKDSLVKLFKLLKPHIKHRKRLNDLNKAIKNIEEIINMAEKRLILCALPYTNNISHVGNIVGSHLPADIFARYCRLVGYETILIGGTDENGSPTEVASIELGVPPQKVVDTYHKIHKAIYDWFNISYDNFSRTSKPIHHKTTQDFFEILYHKGFILEKELKLPYCEKCDLSLPDRYVEGTCPHCTYEKARGDQCDKCTKLLDPVDLKDPKCKVCGSSPKIRKRKHLFLDLPRLAKPLEEWILSNKQWREQVTALALSWLKEGLKERCITRDLKFGIEVPLPEHRDKKFYVWFDAPIGYLSSTKEWAENHGEKDKWELFWRDNKAKVYNFIGKDNIPFHTIFWPGMLIAHARLNLPYQVVGLQYCNYEGDKISKSRNWGVFCEKLPSAGLDVDVWRYYLSLLIPETKDSEFKWNEFEARTNSELIGNLGNFINRTLTFTHKFLGRKLNHSQLKPTDLEFLKKIEKFHGEITSLYEDVKLRDALHKIMELSSEGNKFFQENKPWELVKTDKERCETIIYLCANLCLTLSVLVEPFLPNTSAKILSQLKVKKKPTWKDAKKIFLDKGHEIGIPEILFKQLEKEKIEELKQIVTKPTVPADLFGK